MNHFALSGRAGSFELDAHAAWDAARAALFGASGSGKTTIVEALAGARREIAGRIELGGLRRDDLPARARRLGWVPQDASLFPHKSVRENIRFGAGRAAGETTMRQAIVSLEIGALLDRRPAELSGGERQRVAIARALASDPDYLLLDEPLASIDRPLRTRILPFLRELPIPFLLVTHDPLEVAALAQHVLVIEGGTIVAAGPPASVFASAASFGALFSLAAENRFEVRVVERDAGSLTLETRGGTRLCAVRSAGFPEPGTVAVRAEDVMLAAHDPGRVSAQNVLEGEVEAIEPVGEQLYVLIRTGAELWRAKVTGQAVRSMELEPGRAVVLLIKAHAILPVESPRSPGAGTGKGLQRSG